MLTSPDVSIAIPLATPAPGRHGATSSASGRTRRRRLRPCRRCDVRFAIGQPTSSPGGAGQPDLASRAARNGLGRQDDGEICTRSRIRAQRQPVAGEPRGHIGEDHRWLGVGARGRPRSGAGHGTGGGRARRGLGDEWVGVPGAIRFNGERHSRLWDGYGSVSALLPLVLTIASQASAGSPEGTPPLGWRGLLAFARTMYDWREDALYVAANNGWNPRSATSAARVLQCPLYVCAVTRRRFPVGESPTRQPLQPEATGAVMEETKWLKPSV